VYGVLLFQQGRAAEAREVLRQGVAANPGSPQLCMEWALAEEAAGNLGEAAWGRVL
jgi:predicted Zn-dependent protease